MAWHSVYKRRCKQRRQKVYTETEKLYQIPSDSSGAAGGAAGGAGGAAAGAGGRPRARASFHMF